MNKLEFQDVAIKKSLVCELLSLDVKDGDQGLSQGERAQREEVKSEIVNLATLEDISWRQKLRAYG